MELKASGSLSIASLPFGMSGSFSMSKKDKYDEDKTSYSQVIIK